MFGSWILQAKRDLLAAEAMAAQGFHEWCCFLCLQAAEKAEKAYFLALGMEPPFQRGKEGHDLVKLSNAWPDSVKAAAPAPRLAAAQTRLNQFSEDTRYPHFARRGKDVYMTPGDDFNYGDSEQALEDARAVVGVCEKLANEAHRFAAKLGEILHGLDPDTSGR
jgi:HEPN domain-containing protein